MYIRSKTWQKVHHTVRFRFYSTRFFQSSGVRAVLIRAIECVFVTSSTRGQFVFFYPISMPSPPAQIDNRLPCPPTFALLLTLPLSSPKQTDFRNVASSHPHSRHGFTPGRRRRRRHLSYMRGCLHLQHQNNRSHWLSGPKPDLIPIKSVVIRSRSRYCGTAENKTHHICCSSHPSSYFKNPYDAHAPQKAKQKHRCIQPSQTPWSSPKDGHPHKATRQCCLECKGQQNHQVQICGQRHDRKVLETQNERW